MTPIIHRVNDIKLLKDLPNNYGLEIDVRSNNNNLILSHEPTDQGDFFIDFIEEYNHQLLVVNVKEAGIEKKILDILKNKGIDNFFLLDIEFPFLLQNHSKFGKNLSVRYSKYESIETAKNFVESVSWMWIDTYKDFELNEEAADIVKKFNVCLVSPSRWGQSERLNYFIEKFKNFKIDIDYVMVENGELI